MVLKMVVWKYVDTEGSGQPGYPFRVNQILYVNQGRVNLNPTEITCFLIKIVT